MKKSDIKAVGIVVIGVLAAGYAMSMLRDAPIIGDAANGYGG